MTNARSRRRLARTGVVLVAAVVAGAVMPAAEARPPKGDTARVSEGFKGEQLNGYSSALGLSADGRSALFTSTATNLLPEDGTPNADEVYVRDLRNGHIERVSVADDASKLNAPTSDASISADGRFVAFSTAATNVVPGQAKHESDVFVHDRWSGRTELISTGNLATTDDETIRSAHDATLSADGRYVAFSSDRTDLTPGVHRGKFNVFVTDRWTHTTRLVTTGFDGGSADNNSFRPTISADGSAVGFTSRAGNLVPPQPPKPLGLPSWPGRGSTRTTSGRPTPARSPAPVSTPPAACAAPARTPGSAPTAASPSTACRPTAPGSPARTASGWTCTPWSWPPARSPRSTPSCPGPRPPAAPTTPS
ncbi:PD40 domain-containing protein [Kitasatospora sp. SUK 42]|uniref:TolB family protein n=1 Tax=Kitasatospora sp. SUK 42 TaxID=1588882 RepID=UPI0018CAF197|nr:PD40 domain-containing protein [Kitasatospora sp. SUK 42]MBV2153127.1 PD40 domain-containing protein [Kitasatospora sp. SUK 42]